MAIDRQAEGTVSIATAGASNPITCTPAWPTHTTDDLGLLIVTTKHDTEATPTVTAGGGETWDSVGSASGGGGTFGAGTGPIRITVFRTVATSSSMPTPTVNLAGTNTGRNMQAVIVTARKTVESAYGTAIAFVAEATAGTGWTQAHTTDPGITNGDLLYCIYGVRDDQAAGFSAMGFTATGATISSVTERVDSFTAEGNDQGLGVGTANCTAGTASANGTQTATIGSSETGEMAVLRVREITPKTDPPTLVAYTETAWSGTGTPKSVGASISWEDGDEIYALGQTADNGATMGTPTVSGLTFNAVGSNPVGGGGCQAYSWKAVASGSGSGTIQFSRASGSFEYGGAIWQFRDSDGTGNRATSAGSSITVSLARGDDHSHVIELLGDFDAGSTAGYGWTPSGQTEREAAQVSGAYTNYAADWPDVASAGTTSYGVTGVSGTFTIIAVEVQGTVSAGGDATATPATIAVTAALPQGGAGVGAMPATTATTVALPQGAAGVGAAPAAVAAAVGALPQAAASVGASPAVLAAVGALPQATANTGDVPAVAEPATIAAIAALPQAAASVGATPAVLAAVAALPQTVTSVGATPAVTSAVAALPQPLVGVGATPATLTVIVAVPQASVGVLTTVTPDPIATAVALPQPLVGVGALPATITAVVALPTPTVGVVTSVTPATVAALVALPQATVSVQAVPAVLAAVVALPQVSAFSSTTAIPATVASTVAILQVAIGVGATPATIAVVVAMLEVVPPSPRGIVVYRTRVVGGITNRQRVLGGVRARHRTTPNVGG